MKFHFATLFNYNYISRGLTLLDSLDVHCPGEFVLYILCLDDKTFDVIRNYKRDDVIPIPVKALEEQYRELEYAKKNRNMIEYFFTLSPFLPSYVLEKFPETDVVTSLDSDMMFFSHPGSVFEEMEGKSVMIMPHRFHTELLAKEKFGLFNVSFQSFRRDETGLSILNLWRNQCAEWCYDRLEGDRYADQKYLDKWPSLSEKVHIIRHKGAGAAPWNISNFSLSVKNNQIFVDEQPLVFFHFHGLRFITPNIISHAFNIYATKHNPILKNEIYKPYIEKLTRYNIQFGLNDKAISRYPFLSSIFGSFMKQQGLFYYNANKLVSLPLGLNYKTRSKLRQLLGFKER